MMAAGIILPFVVGTSLPPSAYDVLQISGLCGLLVLGLLYRRQRKKADASKLHA